MLQQPGLGGFFYVHLCKLVEITTDHVVLSVSVQHLWSKKDGLLSGKYTLRNQNFGGAALSGTLFLQRKVELCLSSLTLPRCPPEPPCLEMALGRGAPPVYYYHAEANCYGKSFF
jgi:hypothetical protein